MKRADYLRRLQGELKAFPAEEQARLLEEISAHIEEGEQDPRLGQDAHARGSRLARELGSPEEMGRGLRQAHRASRWLDFCLTALPTVLIMPLLPLAAMGFAGLMGSGAAGSQPFMWLSLRFSVILHAALILLSLWKGSPGVLLTWLPRTMLVITGLLLSSLRLAGVAEAEMSRGALEAPEGVFWLAALGLMLAWLVKVVRAQRGEPLLVVLAALPFLFAAANFAAALTLRLNHIEQVETVSLVTGWFGLHQFSSFVWPALFFLPHQRGLRWLGLVVMTLPYFIYNLWPYRAYPLPLALYTLPVVLVLAAWALDARARPELYSSKFRLVGK